MIPRPSLTHIRLELNPRALVSLPVATRIRDWTAFVMTRHGSMVFAGQTSRSGDTCCLAQHIDSSLRIQQPEIVRLEAYTLKSIIAERIPLRGDVQPIRRGASRCPLLVVPSFLALVLKPPSRRKEFHDCAIITFLFSRSHPDSSPALQRHHPYPPTNERSMIDIWQGVV